MSLDDSWDTVLASPSSACRAHPAFSWDSEDVQSCYNLGDFSILCSLSSAISRWIQNFLSLWNAQRRPQNTPTFLWLLLIRSPSPRAGSWGTWQHPVSKAFRSPLSKTGSPCSHAKTTSLACLSRSTVPRLPQNSEMSRELRAGRGRTHPHS